MPLKVLAQPATRLAGRAGRAKAKAVPRLGQGRGGLKRPGVAEEGRDTEVRGDKDISVVFEEGREVAPRDLPVGAWQVGSRVVLTKCAYWEEQTQVAGVVKGLVMDGTQVRLKLAMEGTRSEALVKWSLRWTAARGTSVPWGLSEAIPGRFGPRRAGDEVEARQQSRLDGKSPRHGRSSRGRERLRRRAEEVGQGGVPKGEEGQKEAPDRQRKFRGPRTLWSPSGTQGWIPTPHSARD